LPKRTVKWKLPIRKDNHELLNQELLTLVSIGQKANLILESTVYNPKFSRVELLTSSITA
jgi:hypothetical protein